MNTVPETPYDEDLEKSVLGSMLVSQNSTAIALTLINQDSFFKVENRLIFKAIFEITKDSNVADSLTLHTQLHKSGDLKAVGGPGYVASLSNHVVNEARIENYCLLLKELQMRRAQIQFGAQLVKKGYDQTQDVFDINNYITKEATAIQNIGHLSKTVSNVDLAAELTRQVEKAKRNEGITGVPTGFGRQDQLFGGWQPGQLIILAARPAMGKTAKALCDVLNMTVYSKRRVLYFSLEMSSLELFKRLASSYTKIDADKFRTGQFEEDDWVRYHNHIGPLTTEKLVIIDDCRSCNDIVNRIRLENLKEKVDCVYIDYLQIVKNKGGGHNREQEVSDMSRRFKEVAMDEDLPVVALCQLSRELEKSQDKRPKLHHLRESGAIEQDADIVTFLHRPHYYGAGEENLAYLIVAKHRNGSLDNIELRYTHKLTLFTDPDKMPF